MSPAAAPPGAGVVGGYVNGLGVARAFARHGVPAAVVTTKPFDIAHRSRAAAERERADDLHERPDTLVEVLERRARDWRGRWAVPTNAEALGALVAHRERRDGASRLALPAGDAAAYLLDKRLMHGAARSAGLPVPALDPPGFPVVVKPLVAYGFMARFGTKVGVARDAGELADWRRRLAGLDHVVLDLVPGADSEIVCHAAWIDAAGAPRAGVTVRKVRQSPPGFGDARLAELAPFDARLHEATVELARRIGLTGLAVAEFKRDARDGVLRFLEVNGRSVVYNRALRRAGFDIAGLALGERPRPTGWRGTWAHLHPDVLYSVRDRIGRAAFMAPYRRPWLEAVWSPRDPVPFLAQWARPPRRGTSPAGAPAARGG